MVGRHEARGRGGLGGAGLRSREEEAEESVGGGLGGVVVAGHIGGGRERSEKGVSVG